MPAQSPSPSRSVQRPPSHRRSRLIPRLVTLVVVLVAAVVAGIAWGLVTGHEQSAQPVVSTPSGAEPLPSSVATSPVLSPSADPADPGDPGPEVTGPSAGALTVREVVPTVGSTVGGEAVVLQGEGFADGLVVRFGVRDATDVQVLSPLTARAVLPPGLPGPVDVEVLMLDGTSARLTDALVYVDRPPRVVMAVRPTLGSMAGGTALTIVGTGFEPGARVVIGGERATEVDVLDGTRITALSPAHEEGIVDIVVRNPGMPAAILAQAYEYVPGPTIAEVRPEELPETGEVPIVITGTGFEPGATVTLNGLAATDVQVVDATRLIAVAPRGVLGSAVLVVVNPDQPAAVLPDAVRYVPAAPPPASTPASSSETPAATSAPVPPEAARPAG